MNVWKPSRREILKSIGGTLITCLATQSSAAASSFPMSFDHAFGTTAIDRVPLRVASLGFLEHDTLLALGTVPVGIKGWFQSLPHATGPWAAHLLAGAQPVPLAGSEIPFETLLDLEPDLIVALYTNLTQEEYDRLTSIAPTIAWTRAAGPWGMFWEDTARLLGRILDRETRAEELIANVHETYRSLRERYPRLAGARGIAGNSAGDTFVVRGPRYDTGALMVGLGIECPAEILAYIGTSTLAHFSWEQVSLICNGLDVILWDVHGDGNVSAMARRMEMLGVYPGEKRIVFNSAVSMVSMAMASQSVLSIPFAAELIAPRLAAAIDGKAAVQVN